MNAIVLGVVGDKPSNNLRFLQAKRMDWNSADVAVHTRKNAVDREVGS